MPGAGRRQRRRRPLRSCLKSDQASRWSSWRRTDRGIPTTRRSARSSSGSSREHARPGCRNDELYMPSTRTTLPRAVRKRSEEHTSELQSRLHLVCRLLLEKKKSIMENTNLSKQQQVSEIMRQMLTQAQTAGQYFTNDQIKEMTRKVSAEVDLVHQQTQNQRYGSSHIGATAKDISNVVTDAASGVVDIF